MSDNSHNYRCKFFDQTLNFRNVDNPQHKHLDIRRLFCMLNNGKKEVTMRKLLFATMAVMLLFLGCPSETEVESITVSPSSASITMSETQQFTATAFDADNNAIDDVEFVWTSSNTAVATVDDDGLATPIAAGTCTITAESGDVEGNATLTVTTGPTEHSGAISADETWYPTGNPHILTGNVSVQDNATLTIMPGCVVKFDPDVELYAGYSTAGAIIADGKADSIILFTSNVASPAAGDHYGIGLYGYTMSTTSFTYCTIEYGGGHVGYGSFYLDNNASTPMNNCTIRYSGDHGVVCYLTGHFDEFANNTISNCAGYAISIYPEFVWTLGTGNTYTGNTNNAVYVNGGPVTTSGTWTNQGVPYVLGGNVNIGSNANNPVVTIAPGTTVQFNPDVELYAGYSEAGGLIADGTSGQITFTSSVSSPAPGDWESISFYEYSIDASCMLRNCTIEYGGSAGYGNIYIADAMPTIENDSIGYSAGYGIYLYGTTPDPDTLLAYNTFYSNTLGDVGP